MSTKEEEKQKYLDQLNYGGLYPSSWPMEHGDNQRSKTYPGGLTVDPSKSLEEQITIRRSPIGILNDPQMIYTREKNQIYSYGGRVNSRYLARLNVDTLEVEQKYDLNSSIYQGGALMHGNGHVYVINGNTLFKFKDGELKDPERVVLSDINGYMTCCNGLVTLDNGYIVIKLFAINIWDMLRLFSFSGKYFGGAAAILILLSVLENLLFGGGIFSGLISLILFLFSAIICGSMVYDEFFVTEANTFRFRHFTQVQHGLFLLVNPDTMKIEYQVVLEDKCTFPRLCVSPKKDNKQHVIVLGDLFVQKFTYDFDKNICYPDKEWEKPYRYVDDKTTRGTGPTMIGRNVFFTNNTYPEEMFCDNYSIWRASVDEPKVYKQVDLTPKGKQGYMWWSVVSNPIIGAELVWDTLNAKLYCFDQDLNLVWTPNKKTEDGKTTPQTLYMHDCMVTSPTSGHVYMTSITEHLDTLEKILYCYFYRKLHRYFVILDAKTGTEIGRMLLTQDKISPRACNMCIGNNDEVYIGLPDSIIQIKNKNNNN